MQEENVQVIFSKLLSQQKMQGKEKKAKTIWQFFRDIKEKVTL